MSAQLERTIRGIVGAANDIRKNKLVPKETWIALLAWYRWGNNICCPHCGSDKYYITTGTRPGYKCANSLCTMKFTASTGTIFHNTNLEISQWMIGINVVLGNFYMPSTHFPKNKICSQKTGWTMLQRLKEHCDLNIKDVWMQLEHLSKIEFWHPNDTPEIKESTRIIKQLNKTIWKVTQTPKS